MKKADEIIRAFIPMLNTDEAKTYVSLFSSWSKVLGEHLTDIAAHSEPVDLKSGSLIVYVDHPGWMQKLDFQKKTILRRLQKAYPDLGIERIFAQRVSNERFLERREARIMGSIPNAPSKPAYSAESTHKNHSEEVSPQQYSVPEESDLAETFKRLQRLSGD